MILKILFGQFEPESVPEVLVCWDEYCLDANFEGYEEACKTAKALCKDFVAFRELDVEIDERELCEIFEAPIFQGKIVPQERQFDKDLRKLNTELDASHKAVMAQHDKVMGNTGAWVNVSFTATLTVWGDHPESAGERTGIDKARYDAKCAFGMSKRWEQAVGDFRMGAVRDTGLLPIDDWSESACVEGIRWARDIPESISHTPHDVRQWMDKVVSCD